MLKIAPNKLVLSLRKNRYSYFQSACVSTCHNIRPWTEECSYQILLFASWSKMCLGLSAWRLTLGSFCKPLRSHKVLIVDNLAVTWSCWPNSLSFSIVSCWLLIVFSERYAFAPEAQMESILAKEPLKKNKEEHNVKCIQRCFQRAF